MAEWQCPQAALLSADVGWSYRAYLVCTVVHFDGAIVIIYVDHFHLSRFHSFNCECHCVWHRNKVTKSLFMITPLLFFLSVQLVHVLQLV